MSQPTITLRVSAPQEENGNYILAIGSVLVLNMSVTDSGDASGVVRTVIAWGDGESVESGYRPIGKQRLEYSFQESGFKPVELRITNQSGETRYVYIPVNVTEKTAAFHARKWAGLAVPYEGNSEYSINPLLQSNSFTILVTGISEDEIQYSSNGAEQLRAGDFITFSQPSKLISYIEVIYADASVFKFSGKLKDTYTFPAVVEVRRSGATNAPFSVRNEVTNWFFPSVTGLELVRSSLRTLLSTRLGERVMRPEVGCRLHEVAFEPNDPVTQGFVVQEIKYASSFEPRANIKSIGPVSGDPNDLKVSVKAEMLGEEFEVKT
jgi:phage baseplate assembly protein W